MKWTIAALIFVAIAVVVATNRHEFDATMHGPNAVLFRSDRLTGQVEVCLPLFALQDKASQPDWCPQLLQEAEIGAGERDKQKLSAAGFSREQIDGWEAYTREKMAASGSTQDEIDHHFGTRD